LSNLNHISEGRGGVPNLLFENFFSHLLFLAPTNKGLFLFYAQKLIVQPLKSKNFFKFTNKTWFSLLFIKINKKKQKVKFFPYFFVILYKKYGKNPKIHPTTKVSWLSFGFYRKI
jgi:hypothetical protein